MSDDTELLRRYVEDHSESAFTELVGEHLNLVYSAALRETNGDGALAEDISQAVFTDLACTGRQLLRHPSLAGWLYAAVRHRAANLRRGDQRRQRREQEAQSMNELLAEAGSPDQAWQLIRPALDDALHELNEADRAAVVLRFLENRPLREVGERLGLNENAARMRVDRALGKLHGLLVRHGITSTAAGVTAALAAGAITPAPAALAASIAGTALACGAAAVSTTLTLTKLMSMTAVKAGLIGALVVAGVGLPAWQQVRLQRARAETEQLRAQEAETRAQVAELAALREEVGHLRKVEAGAAELEQLRQWRARTEPELLRLRGMAGVARRATIEAEQLRTQLARPSAEPGTNLITGAMADAMKRAMEQQVEARLARMTASLRLTREQAQAAREILERQAHMMRQVFSGNSNMEELTNLAREAGNPELQLEALLTPDQKAGYQAYQQDEAARNARQAANTELLAMTSTLNLSPEQEDQVYAALYELSFNQLSRRLTPAATNQIGAIQYFADQKAKALEPVLTPAQLETYRQQQTAQVNMTKDILGKMAGPAGTAK